MRTLVRRILLVLPSLVPALLAPLTASAKDLRYPEKGVPAFVIFLPEEWSVRTDVPGNLIMFNANTTAALVVVVEKSSGALDDIAKAALTGVANPANRKEPAEISGCKGSTYFTTMKNPEGLSISTEFTLVRVDSEHIASASMLLLSGVTKAEETAARLVKNGVKLVTE